MFTIGEMGDYFRSKKYMDRREYWASYLFDACEVVKIRTIETNYAGIVATLEHLFSIFGEVLEDELGLSLEVIHHHSSSFFLIILASESSL